MPPKSDFEVLNQLIDEEEGHYRLRVGRKVYYLTIETDVFDEDTMSHPDLLIASLPVLPGPPWPNITLSRDEDGSLTAITSAYQLPGIQDAWHDVRIEVLSLPRTNRFRSGVHEVSYNGVPAVAKIACFEWDIPRIERETWAYSVLARHQREHPEEPPIAPDFLGHLTEDGRVMGLLLQKIDGEPAGLGDLPACEALLGRLHRLGLIHGDVNRHNFLVDRASGGGVRLIDFEHAEAFNDELAQQELVSLPAELAEETGRGASVTKQVS